MQIPIAFTDNTKEYNTWAIVKTGAQGNFIDTQLADLLKLEYSGSRPPKLAKQTTNKLSLSRT